MKQKQPNSIIFEVLFLYLPIVVFVLLLIDWFTFN